MADTTYVQQLRKTISGEFYFGAMCHETKRRIAISPDAIRGKQRYYRGARRQYPVITVKKSTGLTIAIYSLFSKSHGNDFPSSRRHDKGRQRRPPTEAVNIKGPA